MKTLLSISFTLFFSSYAFANSGLINVASPYSVKQTADRLEAVLKAKGMKIFARIDHHQGAENNGLELRPTQLLIFGNPKLGTPLMQCAQSAAIDLPQKALIWKDAKGKVQISYNDPVYLKNRHQVQDCDSIINKMSKGLKKLTAKAVEAN